MIYIYIPECQQYKIQIKTCCKIYKIQNKNHPTKELHHDIQIQQYKQNHENTR